MTNGMNQLKAATVAFVICSFASANALADDVFYKGKTISIIAAASGSTYDVYARLLANHLGKYVPGHPSIIVRNMPGAGGIRAGNFVALQAPRDGTILAIQNQTLPISQVLFPKEVKFDMAEFGWIGRITDLTNTLTILSRAPASTIDEAKSKELVIGATGTGSGSYQIPSMLNTVLGTKFKIISGYKRVGMVDLAMERGEVQGRYGSLLSWEVEHPDWLRTGKLRHLLQVTNRKTPELAGIPTLQSLARTPDEGDIFKFISSQATVARAVFTTPSIPENRLKMLQAAFEKTMNDKEFLAVAKKAMLPINPLSGPEVHILIKEAVSIRPALAKKVRSALGIDEIQVK